MFMCNDDVDDYPIHPSPLGQSSNDAGWLCWFMSPAASMKQTSFFSDLDDQRSSRLTTFTTLPFKAPGR